MKIILRSPVVWVAVLAVAALAFGYFLVNLGAAKSPVANTRGLPVAIVNRDAGAVVGDERLRVGNDMLDEATASEKIGDKVEWTRLESRSEAVRGISEGRYYGALVIPEGLSEAVGELSGGSGIPVAIANEDRGTESGERVVDGAINEPDLEGVIRWTEVPDAGRALKGMEAGEYAGAIVVPADYSERLAGLAAPSTGETSRPARLELLTNPAADPSTSGSLREVYSGIVRETSAAAGADLTGSLARADASVPAERAPLLADPVREEVSEARPEGGALAPRATGDSSARVEILTNPSAGPFATDAAEEILSGVVEGASDDVERRITGALASNGAEVPPGRVAILAQPIRAEVTDSEPLGGNSGRGLTPFYLMFTASLLGFIGANVIQVNAETLRGEALRAGRRAPSWTGTFSAKAVLSLVLALLLGAVEALVAFGIYGLHREVGVFGLFAFLVLVAAASLSVALLLLTVAGYRLGVLLGSLFIISLGLATSGGTTPVQNLPEVLRSVADALPFKHATDGVRALLFYEGRVEAGLGPALRILSAYVVGSVLLGAAFSMARDALAGRKAKFDGGRKAG